MPTLQRWVHVKLVEECEHLKRRDCTGNMKTVCFLSLLVVAAAKVQYEFAKEWQQWKSQHGKSYQSELEELERHLVWLSNKKYIESHNNNADVFGYTLAMNGFGDLTHAEFNDLYLNYESSRKNSTAKVFDPSQYSVSIPYSIDWRTKGAVGSVKNQGQCGASYAFSAIGALEGAWALAHGKLTLLSEQNVIDCSVPYGNHGCQGGNMYNAYQYIIANEGVDSQSSYGYKARQYSCSYSESGRAAQMSGSIQIAQASESDLITAVAYVGPVSVAIDASSNAFRYYSSGVYDSSRCSSSTSSLNHAMLVTGYGTYKNNDYWLVKNSWGTNWGMYGYIMMSRNKYNQCGIASDASYPTL